MYLNKKAILPKRNTLRHKILKKFNKTQHVVKDTLAKCRKISFRIDSWTFIGRHSYYGITCHYKNDSWKLKSLVLDFLPTKGNHSGEYMATLFFKVLKEYNLADKLQGVTTDNAAVNFTFMTHLSPMIGLQCDAENRHFICFAHVLNLAVQDLMKVINVNYNNTYDSTDEEDDSSHNDVNPFEENVKSNFLIRTRALLKKIKNLNNSRINLRPAVTRF